MNIHEYQAKAVLRQFGVPVPRGVPVLKAEDAEAAARELGGPVWVVKSQIHAGGRGKGTFKEEQAGGKGGVRVVKSVDAVKENVAQMLGRTLVTVQTGPAGRQVNRVYLEDGSSIAREFYLSLLVDRTTSRVAFVVSTEGGMDIEEVAHSHPDRITTFSVDPATGVQPHHGRTVARALGLEGDEAKQVAAVTEQLYAAFVAKDMAMLEINPLILSNEGQIKCLDAKISFDDNAMYRRPRHPGAARPRRGGRQGDRGLEIRPLLRHARRDDRLHGQRRRPRHGDDGHHQALRCPARELPGRRRGATKEKVAAAFKIITADPAVKGILVNIFGGIMKCDVIAEGVIAAVKEVGLQVPLVVRLEGTNVELGKAIIARSGLNVIPADDLDDAAQKIVGAIAA